MIGCAERFSRFQIETGLLYNWHRHYDHTIGRYTQPDPLGFVDGPGRYTYVWVRTLGLDIAVAVIPGVTGAGVAFRAGKRFTADRAALVKQAKEAKQLGGVTEAEAQIMKHWGDEYNILVSGPERHPRRGFGSLPHVRVGPINHIRVLP